MTTPWSPERVLVQEALKQLRLEAQLTQIELAQRLGKPQSYVSKYESGERRLDIIEIREICLVAGESLVKFCERLEESIMQQG